MSADLYEFWRRTLAGDPDAPKPRDGQPQCGFYKMRRGKDGEWIPVAIWMDGDTVVAGAGKEFAEAVDPARIWLWCAKHPVTEDSARQAAETGRWPDEPPPIPETVDPAEQPPADVGVPHPRLGIGGNNPPDDEALLDHFADPPASERALIAQLDKQADDAAEWLSQTKIETKEQADLAANWAVRIAKLNKEVDDARMERRRPLQNVLDKIQALFKPTQDKAKLVASRLETAAREWAKAEERRLREEARRKAEEEARRLAEEHKRKLEQAGLPLEAAPLPPPPKPVAAPKVLVGGGTGRRVGTRRAPRTGRIVDIEKVLIFFKDNAELVAVAQKLVNKVAAAGGNVPGVEMIDPNEEAA